MSLERTVLNAFIHSFIHSLGSSQNFRISLSVINVNYTSWCLLRHRAGKSLWYFLNSGKCFSFNYREFENFFFRNKFLPSAWTKSSEIIATTMNNFSIFIWLSLRSLSPKREYDKHWRGIEITQEKFLSIKFFRLLQFLRIFKRLFSFLY